MKGFLLDGNLPRKVLFAPSQPVTHARDLGGAVSDSTIWKRAREEGWVIVSKDADFSHRMMTQAPPPWVVHLRLGNLRLKDFQSALTSLWPAIEALLPEHKLINVDLDRIEAVKD